MFLIIVTNNFAEIKSTVFKKYEAKTLFPIITSDIVERFYLVCDILFVLARLGISPHPGMMDWVDVFYWLFFIVLIEVATDWLKFCLIVKFCSNALRAETFEAFRRVLIADVLLCRADSS